jgi:hypothetical protein
MYRAGLTILTSIKLILSTFEFQRPDRRESEVPFDIGRTVCLDIRKDRQGIEEREFYRRFEGAVVVVVRDQQGNILHEQTLLVLRHCNAFGLMMLGDREEVLGEVVESLQSRS